MMPTGRNHMATRRGLLPAVGLVLLLAGLALPAAAQDATDDEPPRQDFRMRLGNTQNMHMGRDAAGNEIMEMGPPPKTADTQPQVGPFYIYPQVDLPVQGGQGAATSQRGHSAGALGPSNRSPAQSRPSQGAGFGPPTGPLPRGSGS